MMRRVRSSLAFLSAERLVMNTAYRFVYPFLPVIARGLGVPLEQAALLITARYFSGLATPAMTRAIGRGERPRTLIATGMALFIAGSVVTVLTSAYVGALIGFALLGIAKPVFDVSSQAYISARVDYDKRARYLSVFEFTWAGALLIGAPATGWLIARTSWSMPFIVFGVLTAVSLALTSRFVDADSKAPVEGGTRLAMTSSGKAFLIVAGFFSLGSEMIFVVFGAWLEDSFGLSLAALGGAAFLVGASELAGEGATFAITDRLGKRRAVFVGLIISGIGYALLIATNGDLRLGLAVLAVAFFGFEFTIVSSIPMASELMPKSRARYLAWMIVAMSLARGVGAAVGPLLFERFGLVGPAAAAVVSVLAATAVLGLGVSERHGTSGQELAADALQ
jgi:predicted MFS family arabinose efflux permease